MCLSQAYFSAGRYAESLEALRRVEALKPHVPGIYLLMVDSYTRMQLYNKAITMLKRTFELVPSRGQVHLKLASIYHLMGNEDLALEENRKLAMLDKDLASQLSAILSK